MSFFVDMWEQYLFIGSIIGLCKHRNAVRRCLEILYLPWHIKGQENENKISLCNYGIDSCPAQIIF